MLRPSSSFSFKAVGGLLRVLQTSCHIGEAFNPASQPEPSFKEFVAIWDTGATNSVISQKVIDDCGLKQIGLTQVQGVNSLTIEPTYLVSIRLPNNVGYQEVQVTRGSMPGSDVLIGMDIITTGDLVITNKDGFTWWSFCWPSTRRTDYVAEHQQKAAMQLQGAHGGRPDRPKKNKNFGKHKRHK